MTQPLKLLRYNWVLAGNKSVDIMKYVTELQKPSNWPFKNNIKVFPLKST